jgi:transposase
MLKITFKTFKENIEEIKMVAKEIFDVDYKVEENKQIIIKSENNESEIVINIKQKLTLDQCNLFELTYRNEKVWKILKTLHISYKKYKDNLKSINDILINEFNITSIDLLKASNNGI